MNSEWNENQWILHSLKDDLLVTDEKGIIVRIHEGTGNIYDVKAEKLLGKSVYELENKGCLRQSLPQLCLKQRRKLRLYKQLNKASRCSLLAFRSKMKKARLKESSAILTM